MVVCMHRPLDTYRPFTRDQYVAAGLDPDTLRRSEYRRVFRSVWVHRDGIDDDTRIRAALALHPDGAIASRFSAARVWGLPVPDHPFEHVTVFDARDRRFRPEIKSHVTKRPRAVEHVRGIPVTHPYATFIELAGTLSLVDLVVLGDALIRRRGCSLAGLLKACHASTDYYAGLARLAASYVREGVDSPMETRLRMLIVLAGLPEPEVNVILTHADGTWRRRFDLCYRRIKLIVEYDGRQHAEDTVQWHTDLERREEFDDEGYRILVVTAHGIFIDPARTLKRVRRQLILRGWRDVPPLHDAWKQHFAA
jgi:hypothetical protein